jgi:hypothetical protein
MCPSPLKLKKQIDRFTLNLVEHSAIGSLPNVFNFTFTTNGNKKPTEAPTCEERKMQSRIVKLLRVTSIFQFSVLTEFKIR